MSYASLLPDLCDVKRTARTADGVGGYTSSDSIILRRIACRFNSMSASELALYADKLGTLAGFTVFMEGRHRILEGDLLVKVDDSRQFDVLLVKDYDLQKRFKTLACRERAWVVE